ncbi:hypothetical protein [Methyloradius palustris]|uniref:Uncharacterized protein n=1 Tax=Methyloradius palustris TaxID=2778876 RepID=A0A8D5G1U2_9PROT|nr:hypothetical protein [Methyloradius palustris]BCM24533.1 hypothetical protein ZMTM_07920 [Methyloradius palustris]
MKKLKVILFSKPVLIIGACLLVVAIIFFDNIKGYYRFKELCETEKTKQVINKVEPNMAWIYNEGIPTAPSSVFKLAASPHVKFVRFLDYDDKQLYDITYIGPEKPPRSEVIGYSHHKEFYAIKSADLTQKTVYAWKNINEEFPNELRTGRSGNQIIDMRTNKIVANLTVIGYSLFDRNHTLLDAPSGNTCDWATTYLGSDANVNLIFGE